MIVLTCDFQIQMVRVKLQIGEKKPQTHEVHVMYILTSLQLQLVPVELYPPTSQQPGKNIIPMQEVNRMAS